MSERFDRYDLAARLEKLGDRLMVACEKGEEIENRVAVCNQAGAVCRIVMTLKALRTEARNVEPDDAIAGSAVREYSAAFAQHRAAGAGDAVSHESDTLVEDHALDDGGDDG